MTITSRPDRLPLARPSRIGLPYHGVVIGSTLALPGGGSLTYPYSRAGDTWVLRNAIKANGRAPTSAELADDTAKGRTWQDYAIVAAGRQLGPLQLDELQWVYVDPAGTNWLLEVNYSIGGATLTASVFVRRRFGVMPHNGQADPQASVLAGQASFTLTMPAWYAGDPGDAVTYLQNLAIGTRDLDFTEDGHSAAWNVRTSAFVPGSGINFDLVGWFTITLSGAGSTDPATLGAGITASVLGHALEDVYEIYTEEVVSAPIVDKEYPCAIWSVHNVTQYRTSPPDTSNNCPDHTIGETADGGYDLVTETLGGGVPSCAYDEYEKTVEQSVVMFVFADGVKAKSYLRSYDHEWSEWWAGGTATVNWLWRWTQGDPLCGWTLICDSISNQLYKGSNVGARGERRGTFKFEGGGLDYEIGVAYEYENSNDHEQGVDIDDSGCPAGSGESDYVGYSNSVNYRSQWIISGGSEDEMDTTGWAVYDLPSASIIRKTNNVWQAALSYYTGSGVGQTDGYLVSKNGDETALPAGTDLDQLACSWNPETNDMEWRDTGSDVQWI